FQDLVRFEVKEGRVDMRSSYRVGITASNCIAAITNAMFSLKSFKVAEPGATENLVELDELTVRGITADAAARTAEMASCFGSRGTRALKRNRDSKTNAVELAPPADPATNAPAGVLLLLQAATNAFGSLLRSTNLAAVTVRQVHFTNCAVAWEDLANS